MSLQKSLEEQAQSIREEAKKVREAREARENYSGIATEGNPIGSRVWECSAEHGQLRFTKRRWALFLERVFAIVLLSCLPTILWVFLGLRSFWGLLIAFSLSTVPSTILILRGDVVDREYLLDKDTDRFGRNGKLLCRLTEIDHVRFQEEWVWGGDDAEPVTQAYVVFGDRKESIPLGLAHEIASYIGVNVYDKRDKPPSAPSTGIITLDL